MDETRQLVAGEQHLLEQCVAWQREVLGMREDGFDELLRVSLFAKNRCAVLRMLVQRRMDLVVEVVQQRGRSPELLVLVIEPRVEPHGRLDRERMPQQRLALRVLGERLPGLLSGRPHGAVR
jgi:hypothetical protein